VANVLPGTAYNLTELKDTKMDFSILIHTVLEGLVIVLGRICAILAQLETKTLELLHLPPSTTFRVFPTQEMISTIKASDLYHWRTSYVAILLSLVDHVVWKNRERRPGLVAELTGPLRARSRTFAVVFYLVRVWIVLAIWHDFLVGLAKSDGAAYWPGLPWREWLTLHLL
jgi:hypothetical protein